MPPAPSATPRTTLRERGRIAGPVSTAETADVVVVGGGPAGSAAAITLARAGVDCLLIDKARFPREKCCGDGLTTAALRHLDDLGLDPAAVASFTPVGELSFRAPSGRVSRVPLPRRPGLFGAVARRSELDAALVERAEAAGARTRLGHALTALSESAAGSGAPLELTLDGGDTLRANFVVSADGAWSPLRRLLVGETPAVAGRAVPGDFFAFRAYATGVGPEAASQLWVWFPRPLLPGYAWSFPLAGGSANVGVYLRRTAGARGHDLAAAWEAVLESPFMRSLLGPSAELGASRSWPIPCGVVSAELTACGGRVLFAGDAARAADPFTGEGIAQALESGVAAARALIAVAKSGPRAVGRAYRAAMRRGIGHDQAVGRLCSAVMSTPAGAEAAVALVGATPWTRRSSARWLFEDYPRGTALSPAAWRAVRRPGPGPFAAAGRTGSSPGAAGLLATGGLSPAGWRRAGARGR